MTQQEKINAIASYGLGVYSIPSGFSIADPNDDEDGWYLTTRPLQTAMDTGKTAKEVSFDVILDETIDMIRVSAVEGPLAVR